MKKLDNSKCWGINRSKNEKNKINKSLEVREKINSILKEDNLKYDDCFNDLYKIKGGEVRRLKGYIGVIDDEELRGESKYDGENYNKLFNRVSKLINNLEVGEFKVNINKLINFNKYYFNKDKERDLINVLMNWEDYKKFRLNEETCCIIKIEWKY